MGQAGRKWRALALSGVAFPFGAAAALAQAGDPAALPDIVVTGEKRETPIQSAPLAITALPADLLADRNVYRLDQLDGTVPGLTITKSEGSERVIAIRGIGYETAQNPNSQPGVAFHIDGVYIAHVAALNQDLLDVDRVEVLRGPQGTVFGETSTGGAINVITHQPVIGEASGTASLSYGSYDYVKTTSAVNLPLSDQLAARVAVQYLSHDGYGYATAVPGYRRYPLEDANDLGLRAVLLWQPTDRFSALLSGQIFNTDRAAALQKDITDPDPRARAVTQDYPGTYRLWTRMATLTLSQEVGDWGVLKSVTAFQNLNKYQTADNDRLASPDYFDNIVLWQDRSRTWTQEVSLASTAGSRVEWVAGGFFLGQHALQNILELTVPSAAAVTRADGTPVKFQTDSPYQHRALAAYGNATWHLTDRLSLLAGARYNADRLAAQPFQYFNPVVAKRTSSHAVTGKVGADYRWSPAVMTYLTLSRGYKPNGLNFNAPGLLVPDSFRKETVTALEAGAKTELFDRRLRFNLAAYRYWYNDFQYTAEDPIPYRGGTANVPHAVITGAEAEFTALPAPGVRVDGSVSYGHGHFRGTALAIDAQTAASIRNAQYAALGSYAPYDPRVIAAVLAGAEDLDGRAVPKLPTWQATVSPSYHWHMAGGEVTLRGDVIHRGGFNYRLFAVAALDRVPAYTIANASIHYQPSGKPWTVSVTADNLFNRNGINSRFSDPYGSGTTSVEYIDPREVFATVGFRW